MAETALPARPVVKRAELTAEERYYMASQWQLMWRKFRKHKLAVPSVFLLIAVYLIALTCEFWGPYDIQEQYQDYLNMPPSHIHIVDKDGRLRAPFVYSISGTIDFKTFARVYVEDQSQIHPIRFFAQGVPYRLFGLIPASVHLFDAGEGKVFIFGTDKLGRDIFSRTWAGARISLSIGLVGVLLSFVLGCVLGGISGFFGGTVDVVIQRIIEFLISLPTTPIWMALSAAVPANWSPIRTYFAITLILSIIGWAGLARVVRGKLLELRENDYVMAAKVAGATGMQIIFDHMLPGFMSYLIVHLTLQIPGMILAETALSFLGLGIRAPAVSLGTLMQDAQNVHAVAIQPWLLIPGLLVILTVMLYNFTGDGMRDAANPYK